MKIKSLFDNFIFRKNYDDLIVFIFEENSLIENRLQILKHFNPNIKIYGICTSNIDLKSYSSYLENLFIPSEIYSNQENNDLYLIEWFNKIGSKIKFNYAHIIKWQAIIYTELNKYNEPNSIFLTNLKHVKSSNWNDDGEDTKYQFIEKYQLNEYNFSNCLYSLSYKFIKKYCKLSFSPLLNDVTRLSLYAQILNYSLKDNNLHISNTENEYKDILFPCYNLIDLNSFINKKTTKIIIFIFHKDFGICLNRLEIIKKYNPDIDIYGIYGGNKNNYSDAVRQLSIYLKHIFLPEDKTSNWKWRNSDLLLCKWYKEYGHNIEFGTLYKFEWDMLVLDSIDSIYKHIPNNTIGLTGLSSITNLKNKKWFWLIDERYEEWRKLLLFAKKNYSINFEYYGCFGPGYVLPKSFIDKYSKVSLPFDDTGEQELCHDELRLPLFSQIFNYKLYDTGLYKNILDEEEHNYFNCQRIEISEEVISSELNNPKGRRVFHPYFKEFYIPGTST